MAYDLLMLAAGLGTRLDPLTRDLPKPLLPIHGHSLLDWNLSKLFSGQAGPTPPRRITINSHHLSSQIEKHIQAHAYRESLVHIYEPEILGTGGAIVNARELLQTDPFVVLNSDTLSVTPIGDAIARHQASSNLITLIVSASRLHANVLVEDGQATEILASPREGDTYTFTGCHIVSGDIFEILPRSGFHNIRDTFCTLAAAGRLGAYISESTLPILDIGTPARYLAAHRDCLLHNTQPYGFDCGAALPANDHRSALAPGDFSYIAPSASIRPGSTIKDSILLDNVVVEANAFIRGSIVGPNVRIGGRVDGEVITNSDRCAIEPGLVESAAAQPAPIGSGRGKVDNIELDQSAYGFLSKNLRQSNLSMPGPENDPDHPPVKAIGGDGSNRRLFRVDCGPKSAIFVSYPLPYNPPSHNENSSYLALWEHLRSKEVRVPDLLGYDLARGYFLLEDLGDIRLFELAQSGWGPGPASGQSHNHDEGDREETRHLEECYLRAIDIMIDIQAPPAVDSLATGNRDYDIDFILAYESRYFHSELVQGLASLDCQFEAILPECELLAERALSSIGSDSKRYHPIGLIHRDYQSRNIMATGSVEGRRSAKATELAIIDFQGARLGPPEYDLASLVCDPYVRIPNTLRSQLIARFLFKKGLVESACAPDLPASRVARTSLDLSEMLFQEWIPAPWRDRFLANCANRLMQALGAFAKLGGREEKPGFLEYIPAAIDRLALVLEARGDCPQLTSLVSEVIWSSPYRKLYNKQ